MHAAGYILGGDVSYHDPLGKWLIIGSLVLLCSYLIYVLYRNVTYSGETYYQKQTRVNFDRVGGEVFDRNAQNVLTYGELIQRPSAMDHYRMGVVYLLNAQDTQHAYQHFNAALTQVVENDVDQQDAMFIITRIDDHAQDFEEDLPVQQALMAHWNTVQQSTARSDPTHLQQWKSDSQNVHDTAIYSEMAAQLERSFAETRNLENKDLRNYREITNWLTVTFADQPEQYLAIRKVLDRIDCNYPVGYLPGISEQDIIVEVWRRAYLPENEKNKENIKHALATALIDSVENDHASCMAGRISKVWASLACIDKDPTMGVVRTKQLLRNEIYARASQIVADYVGESGSASDELKTAYNNDEKTNAVDELIQCMRRDIQAMCNTYKGRLADNQLQLITEECKNVV